MQDRISELIKLLGLSVETNVPRTTKKRWDGLSSEFLRTLDELLTQVDNISVNIDEFTKKFGIPYRNVIYLRNVLRDRYPQFVWGLSGRKLIISKA